MQVNKTLKTRSTPMSRHCHLFNRIPVRFLSQRWFEDKTFSHELSSFFVRLDSLTGRCLSSGVLYPPVRPFVD